MAVSPLTVTFDPVPLFNKLNFLPLDKTSGIITVTNNGVVSRTILTEAINILDNDNFGNLLHLIIKEGNTVLFDGSLASFFTSGEVSLGAIPDGTIRTFTYTIDFINSSDNSYQGKTLGFDICVGFNGGDTHCGNTTVGDERGGTTGGGAGGGTGGTSYGSESSGSTLTNLVIFNEQALNISDVDHSASATVTWNTNKLSTSKVVYGPVPSIPYVLNLNDTNFGYPFGTTEDPVKVMDHSVLLLGLTPGEVYVYRVVSRASPPTISYEHQFTVPILVQANNQTNITGYTTPVSNDTSQDDSGSVSGSGSENNPEELSYNTISTNDEASNLNSNMAAAFASGFGNILYPWLLIILIVLIVIYMIWTLWRRRR